ncbi:ABC transporter substrate-binding protein [Acetobacter tropicalis]|uniref:Vitamin B12 ABC transporter, B12-binding component BtuF n=1 Tax=Acetobacter tropicalis TaxID=104102 RepID=A0A094YP23_9PROT|nr:ABC transporter substrate-binding protein [Acetobacter tropicalis]KAA8388603.1 ABC transporter substrate-binding protein [Acetobacter tropicalis]KAA8388682.1 ABC transporter substrate-binding protein [Acetobacter tropicalis]KGB23127.1 Vitamin B12 ABC transporter, B12-binding component BtuF [Acetobacter tropicalis]MBC9009393.1 ABC transporter substrate-binding protein [Acetobacter tropicalis]MDO8172265.1 ABC transporter substrate-binding protein [Acetobacter tropicalis]
MRRWLHLLGLCSLLVAALPAPARAAKRIVSMNLCTDQLALMLADRAEIVGLSPLVQDCSGSVLCQKAQDVPVLSSTAENVIGAHPDVVLAGQFTARVAVKAAREVGAKVLTLPPASSLAEIPVQIMQVAQAVGHPERGQQMVDAFLKRLALLSISRQAEDPVAAVYEANGFVAGAGSLPDDVLAHAGLRNLSTVAGITVAGRVPLETLLAQQPDLLVRDRSGQGYSLAQAMLDNPVLKRFFSGKHVVDIPASLWLCGLPQTLDAVALLRHARNNLKQTEDAE